MENCSRMQQNSNEKNQQKNRSSFGLDFSSDMEFMKFVLDEGRHLGEIPPQKNTTFDNNFTTYDKNQTILDKNRNVSNKNGTFSDNNLPFSQESKSSVESKDFSVQAGEDSAPNGKDLSENNFAKQNVETQQKVTKKYKKMSKVDELDEHNLSRRDKLKLFDLKNWAVLTIVVHRYLPAIADILESTIDKVAFSAYYSSTKRGGSEVCFNDMVEMLDQKDRIINLYVVGNRLLSLLDDRQKEVSACSVSHETKIKSIAKRGSYNVIYQEREKIIKKWVSYLKRNDYTPQWFYDSFSSLNIVQYYVD